VVEGVVRGAIMGVLALSDPAERGRNFLTGTVSARSRSRFDRTEIFAADQARERAFLTLL